MPTKKKAASKVKNHKDTPSALLSQAVNAGRSAIAEASKRLPADWRDQAETMVSNATKKAVQKADLVSRLDKLADQVEALSRRVDEMAPSATGRARARRSQPRATGADTATTPARKVATTAPRKRTTTTRRRPAAAPPATPQSDSPS